MPALGRINSPDAAREAVNRFIGSASAPDNQEAYAVSLSGELAVPYILDKALCPQPCGRDDHEHLGHVLGDMSQEARNTAALAIKKMLSSHSLSNKQTEALVYLVSFLKKEALQVESVLLSLRNKNKPLKNVINHALINMGSVHAAQVLAERLRAEPDTSTLFELAVLGSAGRSAEDPVIELTDHEQWSIREAATSTLGFIDSKKAVPKLLKLLNDPSNLRINWAAAQSLGLLSVKSSVSELQRVAKEHWHPDVRASAKKALKNYETGNEYKARSLYGSRLRANFDYYPSELDSCEKTALKSIKEDEAIKLYKEHAESELIKLSYPSAVIGYGAADEEEQRAEGPDAIIEVNQSNVVELRTPIEQTPHIALRTNKGWLVGSDRGEWRGELVYIGDGQKPQVILNENIEDIYKLGNRYVAITGMFHMITNRGTVYEIVETPKGWSASPWRALPGAARSSWLVDTGELLINTHGGGSVLVSKNGSMRMARCL